MLKERTCESCGAPFEAAAHNQRYCMAQCKRDAENRKRRVARQYTTYDEQTWDAEERRKLTKAQDNLLKNEWILANKTFAMFDIETTNLNASIGEMLCACVKPLGKDPISFIGPRYDNEIAVEIRDELEKYDYVVTWYGTGFDIPFLATRLLIFKEKPLKTIRHVDLYYTARGQFKLHSNALAVAAETFLGDSRKTRIVGKIWANATRRGDMEVGQKAMSYIVDHCIGDVVDLEDLFKIFARFRNLAKTPLRTY